MHIHGSGGEHHISSEYPFILQREAEQHEVEPGRQFPLQDGDRVFFHGHACGVQVLGRDPLRTRPATRPIRNQHTLFLCQRVQGISPDRLFVSQSGHGHAIDELETLVLQEPQFFSHTDVRVMMELTGGIRQALERFVKDNEMLGAITDETLEELSRLRGNLVGSMHLPPEQTDARRGEALVRFWEYYQKIGPAEREGLNNAPCMEDPYLTFGLEAARIESIFSLRVDACAGGTSGVIKELRKRVALYRRARRALERRPV